MKYFLCPFLFFFCCTHVLMGQSKANLTVESIRNDLVNFLIKKEDISEGFVNEFVVKQGKIHVIGLINNYSKNELINGMYSFSAPITHTRTYYLIIENENYTILDLSNIEGLNSSIRETLNFCERNKYCPDLVKTYMSGMIMIYYKNKNPVNKVNINCGTKIKKIP